MFDAWRAEPPIELIANPGGLQVLCNQFIDEAWKVERLATDEEAVWQDQKRWAVYAATSIRDDVDNEHVREKSTFYMYKPSGKVVGLMTWAHGFGRRAVVWNLAMLPGQEAEGAFLVEYAVNLAEKAGYEGRVYFPDFRYPWRYRPSWLQDIQSQIIVPREREAEWVKIDGEWRLVKYLHNHQVDLP